MVQMMVKMLSLKFVEQQVEMKEISLLVTYLTCINTMLNAVEQAERMIESTFGQRYQGGAEHE